jgi:hypothetical protein
VSEVAPLTTYDDSEPLELDSDDASFVAQQLAGRITIRRELADERFRINPGPYVGVVRLPSGTILRSVPRIKTANIFRMLAVAYGLPSLRLSPRVELGDLREMLEFVAEYYADRLEERIEQASTGLTLRSRTISRSFGGEFRWSTTSVITTCFVTTSTAGFLS